MAEFKTSVDQLNDKMGNTSAKFQDFEMWLDVMKVKMDGIKMQSTYTHKDVTKHELESSAKMLRTQMKIFMVSWLCFWLLFLILYLKN